jgi:hypothetical protein
MGSLENHEPRAILKPNEGGTDNRAATGYRSAD